MTREEFIQILDKKGYSYEIIGHKIVITYRGDVNLSSLETLPPGVEFNNGRDVELALLKALHPDVEFKNGGNVYLHSLKTLPPGVEFNNGRDVYLESLTGDWFSDWKGNVEGIDPNRLLNRMIKRGIFL